mgnify:CR=1 FL=1
MNSKLTAEGIMGAAMRMGAELSGGEFPISVFPHKIQRIITELHASQGYPIDYIAAAMLSALAVSIGNSHLAQVKRGWVESPILYMALIGRPGANKSHPLSFAFHPFIEHDYRHNKEYQEQYAEYERTMSMTKKERLEAGKDEFPIPPKRSRFLVSDITPEGLSLIHAQNPRGLCLWSDELSAWFKNFNRYNNGSEEQFWLSVFNAKPTISDRKSSQSSIFIKRPYISVVGTIQQKILGELGKGERASNGFIDRILFVMPQSVQKSRCSTYARDMVTEMRAVLCGMQMASASVFTGEVWISISASGSTARAWATTPTGVSSSPVASSAMNCESTASNSSKTLYDSSRSICPATGINTSAPRMTTTSITRNSTSPASNAALWARLRARLLWRKLPKDSMSITSIENYIVLLMRLFLLTQRRSKE